MRFALRPRKHYLSLTQTVFCAGYELRLKDHLGIDYLALSIDDIRHRFPLIIS